VHAVADLATLVKRPVVPMSVSSALVQLWWPSRQLLRLLHCRVVLLRWVHLFLYPALHQPLKRWPPQALLLHHLLPFLPFPVCHHQLPVCSFSPPTAAGHHRFRRLLQQLPGPSLPMTLAFQGPTLPSFRSPPLDASSARTHGPETLHGPSTSPPTVGRAGHSSWIFVLLSFAGDVTHRLVVPLPKAAHRPSHPSHQLPRQSRHRPIHPFVLMVAGRGLVNESARDHETKRPCGFDCQESHPPLVSLACPRWRSSCAPSLRQRHWVQRRSGA